MGKKEFGVAFIVDKSPSMKDCIRFFFKLWLANVHARTEEKNDEATKDIFYSRLDVLYGSLQHSDVKILLGDLNVQIKPVNNSERSQE